MRSILRSVSPAVAGLVLLVVASFALRVWMGFEDRTAGRFWDERYALENVAAVLEEGTLRPANAFHPSLAHLPQSAVLGTARALCSGTSLCADAIVREGEFTPLAYGLARGLQALFGAASLVLLFLVGRRLFGPAEGLLAAALLALVPWHIRQSVIYKPDILLVLLTLAVLYAALAIAARPDLRRHLVAGGLVGLATAAKYNGAATAFLLLPGALLDLGRRPRRLLWLLLAGLAAVAAFVALNPYLVLDPELVLRNFGRTLRDYERKGALAGTSGPAMVLHAVTTLLSESFHGPLVGAAGLGGLALLVVAGLRAPSREEREARFLLAAFPVLYVTFFALATRNPSAHNWLPLAPFTALGAAWLAVAAFRWARARRPAWRGWRPVGAVLVAAVVLLSVASSLRYTYFAAVPSTMTLAQRHVLGALPEDLGARLVAYDPWEEQRPVLKRSKGNRATLVPLEPSAELSAATLAGFDAAILRPDRRSSDVGTEIYGGARVTRFVAAPFRAWGPPLRVVVEGWERLQDAASVPGRGGVHRLNPARLPGDVEVSFLLVVRFPAGSQGELKAEWNGEPLPLHWTRKVRRRHHFASRRVRPGAGDGSGTLVVTRGGAPLPVEALRVLWRRGPELSGAQSSQSP